jgi:hypothetical protein
MITERPSGPRPALAFCSVAIVWNRAGAQQRGCALLDVTEAHTRLLLLPNWRWSNDASLRICSREAESTTAVSDCLRMMIGIRKKIRSSGRERW